ncbi:hypothetical protein HGRIS_013834 [Hohenbuehelia grisea]|uniref:Uncharacterized protein n=1 Tax=Hohenbuehelia grisea TaxID=104357 RepID=A0ABR3IX12_9AGAR
MSTPSLKNTVVGDVSATRRENPTDHVDPSHVPLAENADVGDHAAQSTATNSSKRSPPTRLLPQKCRAEKEAQARHSIARERKRFVVTRNRARLHDIQRYMVDGVMEQQRKTAEKARRVKTKMRTYAEEEEDRANQEKRTAYEQKKLRLAAEREHQLAEARQNANARHDVDAKRRAREEKRWNRINAKEQRKLKVKASLQARSSTRNMPSQSTTRGATMLSGQQSYAMHGSENARPRSLPKMHDTRPTPDLSFPQHRDAAKGAARTQGRRERLLEKRQLENIVNSDGDFHQPGGRILSGFSDPASSKKPETKSNNKKRKNQDAARAAQTSLKDSASGTSSSGVTTAPTQGRAHRFKKRAQNDHHASDPIANTHCERRPRGNGL